MNKGRVPPGLGACTRVQRYTSARRHSLPRRQPSLDPPFVCSVLLPASKATSELLTNSPPTAHQLRGGGSRSCRTPRPAFSAAAAAPSSARTPAIESGLLRRSSVSSAALLRTTCRASAPVSITDVSERTFPLLSRCGRSRAICVQRGQASSCKGRRCGGDLGESHGPAMTDGIGGKVQVRNGGVRTPQRSSKSLRAAQRRELRGMRTAGFGALLRRGVVKRTLRHRVRCAEARAGRAPCSAATRLRGAAQRQT